MRSEYLGACSLMEGLAETISRGMVLTPRMTREHCRKAILGPASVCGFRIEEPLVNQLLNDLANIFIIPHVLGVDPATADFNSAAARPFTSVPAGTHSTSL